MIKVVLEIPKGSELKQNTSSDLIVITKDKVENILLKHLKYLDTKAGWVTPLGLVVSIGLTFATTNFKKFIGIDASVWAAIFIISLVISCIWLLESAAKAFLQRKKSNIEYMIGKFQSESESDK